MQICHNDTDIERALTAWAGYGPSNTDPSAAYTSTTHNTIGKLFSKAASKQPSPSATPAAGEKRKRDSGAASAAAAETLTVLQEGASGLTASMSDPAIKNGDLSEGRAVKQRRVASSVISQPESLPSSLHVQPPASEMHSDSQGRTNPVTLTQQLPQSVPSSMVGQPGQSNKTGGANAFQALMGAAKQSAKSAGVTQPAGSAAGRSVGGSKVWDFMLCKIAEDPVK